jgi:hypothetical protein
LALSFYMIEGLTIGFPFIDIWNCNIKKLQEIGQEMVGTCRNFMEKKRGYLVSLVWNTISIEWFYFVPDRNSTGRGLFK